MNTSEQRIARLEEIMLTDLLKEAMKGCTQTEYHDWEIRVKKALRDIHIRNNKAAALSKTKARKPKSKHATPTLP